MHVHSLMNRNVIGVWGGGGGAKDHFFFGSVSLCSVGVNLFILFLVGRRAMAQLFHSSSQCFDPML